MSDRFTVARAQLGSPTVYDTEARRPILVVMRGLDAAGEPNRTGSPADVQAVRIAELCAWALNRSHAEAQARRPGGRS